MSADLFVEAQREVKYYGIQVELQRDGDNGTVLEEYRSFDAGSEEQAVMEAYNNYEDEDYSVVRLKYIKKYYEVDE